MLLLAAEIEDDSPELPGSFVLSGIFFRACLLISNQSTAPERTVSIGHTSSPVAQPSWLYFRKNPSSIS